MTEHKCQSCGQKVEVSYGDRQNTVCDNCDALLDTTEVVKSGEETYWKAQVWGKTY